jgi:hypothetical protein
MGLQEYIMSRDAHCIGWMKIVALVASVVAPLANANSAEIERNWALGKPALQSSTSFGGDASRALDGNRDGAYASNSTTHTSAEHQSYWQIDLGAAYYIDEVRIFNRTDCCSERLRDFVVFFANNVEGFRSPDLQSTLSQGGPSTATAVHLIPVFQPGDIDPQTGERLPRHTLALTPNMCGDHSGRGCLMRHLRIQLAGDGPLSLAEVELVEKYAVPGPATLATALTWVPTEIESSGIALASNDTHVLGFYQGDGGRLHGSVDLAAGLPVRNSPVINGVPAVAYDQASRMVHVAVRTRANDLVVATGTDGTGASPTPNGGQLPAGENTTSSLSDPKWTTLGKASAAPAILIACDRIYVAWLDSDNVFVSTRSVATPDRWVGPEFIGAGAKGAPSIAANSDQSVGVSFVRRDGSIAFREAPCDRALGPLWSEEANPSVRSVGTRANLAAHGPYFMLSTTSDRRRASFALQAPNATGRHWQPPETLAIPDPDSLMEDPQLFVMSGITIAVARSNRGELYSWVRWPNRLSGADGWVGAGRVVGTTPQGGGLMGGGGGVVVPPPGGLPTSMVAFGKSRVWGSWDAPAELFVAAVGANRRVHALNLGRFTALSVLTQDLGIRVGGQVGIRGGEPDRGVDASATPNLFEQMVGVLTLPKAAVIEATQSGCEMHLRLDRSVGGQNQGGCPLIVVLGTEIISAHGVLHEWQHGDAARRQVTTWPQFTQTFPFDPDRNRADPARNGMRACQSNADCGGGLCELAGADNPGAFNDTRDFADPELELRRWDDVMVCVAAGGPDGRRYQGGVRWYDLGTADHAFIEAATAYRWFGDELRDLVGDDLAQGNDQLQRRYNWIRDHYYDGIEYNGRAEITGGLPGSNRTLGLYGLPLQ